MRCHLALTAFVLSSALASAGIYPPVSEVSVSIPELVSKSSFVCKGEVTSAPEVRNITGPLPRMTGIASVRIDRCFKGKLEGTIRMAADEYRPSAGWGGGGHIFTPQTGEYLLLFLNRKSDLYELVDQNRGALPVSTLTSTTADSRDPLTNLENDFKAGLSDPDPEMVLKSICWLGQLRHLRSTKELHSRLDKADPVERAYLWVALLSVGDLSIVRDVANYLDQNPPVSRPLFLPRDRLLQMQGRVFGAFCALRDPIVIPFLEHFTESPEPRTRVRGLMALREIGSISSAAVFLRALDDHHEDIDFIGMQSLIELGGGGPIDWVPTFEEFKKRPEVFAALCGEWWKSTGEAKARARAASATGLSTRWMGGVTVVKSPCHQEPLQICGTRSEIRPT